MVVVVEEEGEDQSRVSLAGEKDGRAATLRACSWNAAAGWKDAVVKAGASGVLRW